MKNSDSKMEIIRQISNIRELTKRCRLCLTGDSVTQSVNTLFQKIEEYTGIKILQTDGGPQYICVKCEECIENWSKFKEQCNETQEIIRHIVEMKPEMLIEVVERPLIFPSKKKPMKSKPNGVNEVVTKLHCVHCDVYFDDASHLTNHVSELHGLNFRPILPRPCAENPNQSLMEEIEEYDVDVDHLENIIIQDVTNTLSNTDEKIEVKQESNIKGKTKLADNKRCKNEEKVRRVRKRIERYLCGLCDDKYTRLCDLLKHDKLKHIDLLNGEVSCNSCGLLFVTETRLEIHREMYHGKKSLTCDICKVKIKNKSGMRVHMKKHTNVFKCTYCYKSTNTHFQLQEHIRIHTGEKPYKCEECGSRYSAKQGLLSHLKVHSTIKQYKCDTCDIRFRSATSATLHKLTHKTSKESICEVCGKAFKNTVRLQEHIARCHVSENKTQKCDQCARSFRLPYELKKHQKIHKGKKPFTCIWCPSTFEFEGKLRIHETMHKLKINN